MGLGASTTTSDSAAVQLWRRSQLDVAEDGGARHTARPAALCLSGLGIGSVCVGSPACTLPVGDSKPAITVIGSFFAVALSLVPVIGILVV
jgi:hypothetical protein